MDGEALNRTLSEGVKAGYLAPNEARRRVNLAPVIGGESPLAQQQNFSLEALAKRDAKDDPFNPSGGAKQIGDLLSEMGRAARALQKRAVGITDSPAPPPDDDLPEGFTRVT